MRNSEKELNFLSKSCAQRIQPSSICVHHILAQGRSNVLCAVSLLSDDPHSGHSFAQSRVQRRHDPPGGPNLADFGPQSAEVAPSVPDSDVCGIWPTSGSTRSIRELMVDFWQIWSFQADVEQFRTSFGESWPKSRRIWGRCRTDVGVTTGRFRPNTSQHRSEFGLIPGHIGRRSPMFSQIREHLARIPPNLAGVG